MKKIMLLIVAMVAAAAMTSCSDGVTTKYYYYGIAADNSLTEIQAGAKESLNTELTNMIAGYQGQVNIEESMKWDFQSICATYNTKLANGKVYLMRSEKVQDKKLVDPVAISTYIYTATK